MHLQAYRGGRVPLTSTAIGVFEGGVGIVSWMWIKRSVFWVKRVGKIYASISTSYMLA